MEKTINLRARSKLSGNNRKYNYRTESIDWRPSQNNKKYQGTMEEDDIFQFFNIFYIL